jgi:hypothetical protein
MFGWEQPYAGKLLHAYDGHADLPLCGDAKAMRSVCDPVPRTTYCGPMPPPPEMICDTCKTWERDHDPMFIAGREYERLKMNGGMNLVRLQREVNYRWSLQLGNPCHESADAGHALVHLTKALGRVASAFNDAEHEKRAVRGEEVAKYIADIVICAARFSDGIVDLNEACRARLEEKFPSGELTSGTTAL